VIESLKIITNNHKSHKLQHPKVKYHGTKKK
jgi:hypothetical protein